MLERSKAQGVEKIMVTGGSLEDAAKAIELVKLHGTLAYFL